MLARIGLALLVCSTGCSLVVGDDDGTTVEPANCGEAWSLSWDGRTMGDESSGAVAVDSQCNTYICAQTIGNLESQEGRVVLGIGGTSDVAVVKVNTDGVVVWDKVFGGLGDDHCNAIAVSPDDSQIAIAGALKEQALFEPLDPVTLGLTTDPFVARLDAEDGEPLGFSVMTTTFEDEAFAVAVGPDNQIAVGGYVGDSALVDGEPLPDPQGLFRGGYLVIYEDSAMTEWTGQWIFEGAGFTGIVSALERDAMGRLLVGGSQNSGTALTQTCTYNGDDPRHVEAVFGVFDWDGSCVGLNGVDLNGDGLTAATGITADPDTGEVYGVGFSDTPNLLFGGGKIESDVANSAGRTPFVAKYGSDMVPDTLYPFGGPDRITFRDIALDKERGTFAVVGSFFGEYVVGGNTLSAPGVAQGFSDAVLILLDMDIAPVDARELGTDNGSEDVRSVRRAGSSFILHGTFNDVLGDLASEDGVDVFTQVIEP